MSERTSKAGTYKPNPRSFIILPGKAPNISQPNPIHRAVNQMNISDTEYEPWSNEREKESVTIPKAVKLFHLSQTTTPVPEILPSSVPLKTTIGSWKATLNPNKIPVWTDTANPNGGTYSDADYLIALSAKMIKDSTPDTLPYVKRVIEIAYSAMRKERGIHPANAESVNIAMASTLTPPHAQQTQKQFIEYLRTLPSLAQSLYAASSNIEIVKPPEAKLSSQPADLQTQHASAKALDWVRAVWRATNALPLVGRAEERFGTPGKVAALAGYGVGAAGLAYLAGTAAGAAGAGAAGARAAGAAGAGTKYTNTGSAGSAGSAGAKGFYSGTGSEEWCGGGGRPGKWKCGQGGSAKTWPTPQAAPTPRAPVRTEAERTKDSYLEWAKRKDLKRFCRNAGKAERGDFEAKGFNETEIQFLLSRVKQCSQ